ncbi:hypothetical protein [Haloglomus halophilum]|uniref:hypothetical protein n=1 Tax=Haloglomus halophilum TaxID=2962672 RepID=UPI0020CA1834|nr:hypothetical protein [Haloglomus halophilum]
MDSRIAVLLAGLVVGAVAGGLAVAATQSPQSGVSVPSMGTTAATGCLSGDEPRAWVGQTSVDAGEYRAVYLQNYSFTHDTPNLAVRGDLTEASDGRWELALTTEAETPTKEVPDDCQPRTTVSASAALPPEFETLTVTLDGDEIVVIEHSGKQPAFRYLNESSR